MNCSGIIHKRGYPKCLVILFVFTGWLQVFQDIRAILALAMFDSGMLTREGEKEAL